MFREKEICNAIRTAYLHLFPDKKERKRALSRLDLELVAQGVRYRGESVLAYTVMIWDEKDEQWFGVEHCKAPELLRDALLDGYRDFLEQQLTHNRRSLTETEILDIQNRCEQLYDLCGE